MDLGWRLVLGQQNRKIVYESKICMSPSDSVFYPEKMTILENVLWVERHDGAVGETGVYRIFVDSRTVLDAVVTNRISNGQVLLIYKRVNN